MKLLCFSLILLLLLLLSSGLVVAQEKPDTDHTSGVYKKIEDYSSKRKFTNLVYNLILKPVGDYSSEKTFTQSGLYVEHYAGFENKIIRKITIVTLDPFGFTVFDTTSRPRSTLEKTGNTLHVKSLHTTIRNHLLIHKNDAFDSLMVKESERLIRSQRYVQDIKVDVALSSANSDSVDLTIRVLDLWSIDGDFALSKSAFTISLTDRNLGGLGHTYSNTYKQNFTNGDNAFSTFYYVPNFKNTYINARLSYSIDEDRNYTRSISFERPFFSPLAQWASGALFTQQLQPAWVYKNDTTRLNLLSKANFQDYWAAAAIKLFKGRSATARTTKLIISGRVFGLHYLQKPLEQPELIDYYTNELAVLSGIGISSRKYVKQNYIYKFGTTEDVPIGLAYGLVFGYQMKNQGRWYWGLRYSWGNFFNLGYIGTSLEYGTFINASYRTDGTLKAGITYFSPMFSVSRWKIRQFVKPELTIGYRRTPFNRLSLNDGYGLNGFNSDVLSGTSRFLLVFQTQTYAPWNLIGFRFGPYINLALGMLGDENNGFSHSRMYPQIGMGVLIKND
ncbi:MAG: hypothetical protein ACOYN4_09280, partial [Bacteroidales bacterium]